MPASAGPHAQLECDLDSAGNAASLARFPLHLPSLRDHQPASGTVSSVPVSSAPTRCNSPRNGLLLRAHRTCSTWPPPPHSVFFGLSPFRPDAPQRANWTDTPARCVVHANPLNIITPLVILFFAGTYNSKSKSKLLRVYHNQVAHST